MAYESATSAVWMTGHEIEGDPNEERQTEFSDYTGNFVYGLFSSYTARIFHYNWM